MSHIHVKLLARYVTFGKSLLSNDAFPVRFLASLSVNEMRTVPGRTLKKISDLCEHSSSINDLTAKIVKQKVAYMPIPETEVWRLGVIKDMRQVLDNDSHYGVISHDEANAILEYVCVT